MANEQTISKFYTAARSNDFARQYQFRVTELANVNLSQNELVYLESASLPGRAINNIPVPFMGLQFNVPGTASYPGSDAWNVTFRCDQDYDIRKKLETVNFNTFDESTSTGSYNIPALASVIELELLGKKMEVIRRYKLIGAYVVSLGDVAFSLADAGTVQTVTATLAYQYWKVTKGN